LCLRRARDGRFALTAASAPAIARICARLDGLPLALELAAARTGILGVEELLARLRELSGLGRGPRDASARHHTLRATIEWSYRLLDAEQRGVFCAFAVFAGGAKVDAARAVTGGSIETLEKLLAKSLIDRLEQRDGSTRLVMLETVRRYGLEPLAQRSMERSVREAHAAYYLHLIEQAASRLRSRDEHVALAAIDSEIDNVHAALQWALQFSPVSALKLAGHLGDFGTIRGEPRAQRLLDAALNAAGEQAAVRDRARAHLQRGRLLGMDDRHDEGIHAWQRALALYCEVGDNIGITNALGSIGMAAWNLGDVELARTSTEASYRYA
jgi:predicted ATPase